MRAEGVKREYNDCVNIEERLGRIESNVERLAVAQERLSNVIVVMMNALETSAEGQARLAARVERSEQNFVRLENLVAQISEKVSEISDKLNGLIGYVDGMKRDDRPPR